MTSDDQPDSTKPMPQDGAEPTSSPSEPPPSEPPPSEPPPSGPPSSEPPPSEPPPSGPPPSEPPPSGPPPSAPVEPGYAVPDYPYGAATPEPPPYGVQPPYEPPAAEPPAYGQPQPEYGQQAAYGQPGQYQQPGYGQPAYAYGGGAPYGTDPYGRPYSDKSKVAAGVLQILLGWLGAGRFYTGHTGMAVAQLLVSLVTCGIGSIWGLIDGIVILTGNPTDAQGRPLRP